MRCQAETAVTFAARFSWWRFHVGAKKFALRRCVIAKARKSSPGALKTPQIRRFCACWASFFAERPLEAPCWASFFAEEPLEGPCWASIFAPTGAAPKCRRCRGALQGDCGGGFAPCEALCRRVAGVSEAWMASFPADWWRRGRDLRWCGRQSADPLDKSR